MINDAEIGIAGAAGQGMQTIAFTLGKTFACAGYFSYTYHDIMSRIRGGSNLSVLRIKNTPVSSISYHLDLLVALDFEGILKNKNIIKKPGLIIYDGEKIKLERGEAGLFSVPLERLALEAGKDKVTVNSVATGAVVALLNGEVAACCEVIRELFAGKSEEVIANNINAVKSGFEYAKKNMPAGAGLQIKPANLAAKSLFINGSDALALAAIASGLKFYAGYPMSPSTAVMEYVAAKANSFKIIYEQAEDEIAAINMVVGAAYSGVRAMTATSGGGFALMTEGISLAGMTETPVVIVLTQRPGPATGFPTRTEQADLNMALYSGHGEFAKVILAPGTAAECFIIISRAFNLAEKYQVPVIVLTDQCLNDSSYTLKFSDLEIEPVNRGQLGFVPAGEPYTYQRYSLKETGVSPRLVPGCEKQVVCEDSDEHTEAGHISESAELRKLMVQKRLGKLKAIAAEIRPPAYSGANEPEILLVSWGSTFGAVKEAVELLNEKGVKAAMLHFSEIWPLPELELPCNLAQIKNIIAVEGNATGQFGALFSVHTGVTPHKSILRFDGRPITAEYIITKV